MPIKLKQPTALTVVAKRGPVKTTYPPGHFDPFYMKAAPYEHANVLGEAPNVSHKPLPPVHPIERIFGAIVGLAFVCVIWAAYAVWTSRASIAALAWRFFL